VSAIHLLGANLNDLNGRRVSLKGRDQWSCIPPPEIRVGFPVYFDTTFTAALAVSEVLTVSVIVKVCEPNVLNV
jgi:hypothetical protein